MAVFLFLSLVGLLWSNTYLEVIQNKGWFMGYSIFIGFWVGIFPAREYYVKNEDYFDRIF